MVIFVSLILDLVTFIQVKKSYIKQTLSIASLVVDSLIFACFIWGIIYIRRHKLCKDVKLYDAALVLLLLVFIRVLHVLLLILYILFVLPCYYLPENCCCRKMLMKNLVD